VPPSPANAIQSAIRRIAGGESLSADEARSAFELIMRGEGTAAQISALLVGLRVKGETEDEVAGVVQALRGAMVRLAAARPEELVDTCGTGGGTVHTFNISTAAALLAAGLGLRIAKHGNRSFTTQCGSADVLEALGIKIEVGFDVMERSLADAGIVFMFAPLMHPAMKHVGPVRRELMIPTVMNVVGPLANPAMAGRQVIGVAEDRRVPLLAGALRSLGTRHAMVVHGTGMDEISPLAPTHVVEIRESRVDEWSIDPATFGYKDLNAADLAGGTPEVNAKTILAALSGESNRAVRGALVLNAGAALYVGGKAPTFREGVATAEKGVDSKAGMAGLERLRTAYRQ
jgi:anthranilate phosphoribosyltransferase